MAEYKIVIPTIRLESVAKTAKIYRDNLNKYQHNQTKIMIFDDSSKETFDQRYHLLKKEVSDSNLIYIGPHEKETYKRKMIAKIGTQHEKVIRRALRPSYGGNRNIIALYTLGDYIISIDDDIRPHGLMHKDPAILSDNEVQKGTYVEKENLKNEFSKQESDVLSGFMQVLGKRVGSLEGFITGKHLNDTNIEDLVLYASKGGLNPNTVFAENGKINPNATVKMAQSFLTGSGDLDARDYMDDFLVNPTNTHTNDLSHRYTLQAYRPAVLNEHWLFACGVAGYDNTQGLPPFFPTTLRFEDFAYCLWIQNPDFAFAMAPAVQTHYRDPIARKGLAFDLLNEEIACLMKPKLKEMLTNTGPTTMTFKDDGIVSLQDTNEILERGDSYISSAKRRMKETKNSRPLFHALYKGFVEDMHSKWAPRDQYGFRDKVQKIVDEELSTINQTLHVWPALIEETDKLKKKSNLPTRIVDGTN